MVYHLVMTNNGDMVGIWWGYGGDMVGIWWGYTVTINGLYHLVMTFTVCHENSTMLLIGKPSISMGHLYHGYVE